MFEIARHFPLLAERGAIWAKVELRVRFLISDADRFGAALHLNEEGVKQFPRRLGAGCGNVNQLNSYGN